uniref:Actin-binding transcription modulator n=1 Tax=Steinernema glaseri TaxID=37863 RepID=A0A1I8ADX0_9BILA
MDTKDVKKENENSVACSRVAAKFRKHYNCRARNQNEDVMEDPGQVLPEDQEVCQKTGPTCTLVREVAKLPGGSTKFPLSRLLVLTTCVLPHSPRLSSKKFHIQFFSFVLLPEADRLGEHELWPSSAKQRSVSILIPTVLSLPYYLPYKSAIRIES